MNLHASLLRMAAVVLVVGGAVLTAATLAQTVDTTPSKKTLDQSSKDNCEAVSAVVQRCAQLPKDTIAKPPADDLTRSREAAKQGFDREDRRQAAEVVKSGAPSVNTPVGDAQQLGGVTVTGKSDNKLSVEEVLQKAIGPPTGVSNGNGTVSHFGQDGTRYDCIEKCVGPACCAQVRTMPNPARVNGGFGGPGAL
jgi:hypothetical protein